VAEGGLAGWLGARTRVNSRGRLDLERCSYLTDEEVLLSSSKPKQAGISFVTLSFLVLDYGHVRTPTLYRCAPGNSFVSCQGVHAIIPLAPPPTLMLTLAFTTLNFVERH